MRRAREDKLFPVIHQRRRREKHRRPTATAFSPLLSSPVSSPYLVLRARSGDRGGLRGRVGGGSRRVGDRRGRNHDRVFCRHFFGARALAKKDALSLRPGPLCCPRSLVRERATDVLAHARRGAVAGSATRDTWNEVRDARKKEKKKKKRGREREKSSSRERSSNF